MIVGFEKQQNRLEREKRSCMKGKLGVRLGKGHLLKDR